MNFDFSLYFTELFIGQRWGVNYILTTILNSIAIVFIFNQLKYDKKGILIKIADLVVVYGLYILLGSLLYSVTRRYMTILVITILTIPHMFIFNKMSWFDRVIECSTLIVTTLLVYDITSAIGMLMDIWELDFIFVIIFNLATIFMLKWFSMKKFETVSVKAFAVCTAVPVLIFTAICINTNRDTNAAVNFQVAELAINAAFYVIALIVYYLFYQISLEFQMRKEQQALYFKQENDKFVESISKDNLEDFRKMRHDIKNQYAYMDTLLKNKQYDELEKFFSDVLEESTEPLNFPDVGNQAISAILNMEIKKAKKSNINFEHRIYVPEVLPISDYDLCRLLTNISDIAIEAVLRSNIEDATVKLSIIYKEPNLIIEITNPYDPKVESDPLNVKTSKEDKDFHGYGRQIIDEVVKKYNGVVKYKAEDQTFSLSIMLICSVEEKEVVENA